MVLQTRWDIVRHPVRTLGVDFMCEVTVCVIIHNMIFVSEHDDTVYDQDWEYHGEVIEPQGGAATFQEFLHLYHEIHHKPAHLFYWKPLWFSTCDAM
jgi:hypothetical protein